MQNQSIVQETESCTAMSSSPVPKTLILWTFGTWHPICVFVKVTIAVKKHCQQKDLGKERFYLPYIPYHCSSSMAVMTGTQEKTVQKLGDKFKCTGHGGVKLAPHGLFVCFLIDFKTTSPEMASPIIVWPLPHQSLIEKNVQLAYLQTRYGGTFLI